MVGSSLKKCFANILKEVLENPLMSEDELYSVLVKAGFFEELGYERFGVDVKPQYVVPGERKKADYICRDEYQNVIFVLEAKKPRDEKLEDALGQLWERYVLPLKAVYGVLTNGKRFLVYKRVGSNAEPLLDVNLKDATESDCNQLHRALKKPEYDITLHSRVQEYFARIEKLSLKTDLAKENFFETFKLNVDSIFGRLILDLMELFDCVYPRSKFLKGAYGFWQRSFAREPEKIPESWKPFLKGDDDVFKFMFCLESAHALLARLILAKACEDLKFPGIGISNFVVQKIHQFRGQIPLVGYPIVLLKLLKEMKDQLVYSIFEEDIFSWWSDGFTLFSEKSSGELLQERVAEELENFSKTIAQLLFILYKYDFSEVAGDPLGGLYQQYFDKETRKTLGEFYTPVEVVNYILDAVEYKNVRHKRLLDPACGSGTFLVEALHRYLKEMEPVAKKDGWASVLRELCNSPRIVGLDIHPFACLIAQVRFMLELMPYYKKAIEEERFEVYASLQRLPIFRTDSLAVEMRPQEFQRGPKLLVTEEDIRFTVSLPMKANGEETVAVNLMIPSWKKTSVGTEYNLFNLDEYFCVTQAMFDAVKAMVKVEADEVPTKGLEAHVKKYLTNKDFHVIAEFFKPYADHTLKEVRRLQTEFEDGRLIKSIEDSVLAALLKNYLRYDFVLGNPPYVRVHRLLSEQKKNYKRLYRSAYGKFDLYALFVERGIAWLAENGKLGFITSDQFMYREYGKKLRQLILQNCLIKQILDFGASGVFLDVANYPSIIVLERNPQRNAQIKNMIKYIRVPPNVKGSINTLSDIKQHLSEKQFFTSLFDIFENAQSFFDEDSWKFMPAEERKIFQKIVDTHLTLGDVGEAIFGGVQTGADRIYLVSLKRDEDSVACVTRQDEKHGESPLRIERETLKPFLKGENVRRWTISWDGLFVIYLFEKRQNIVQVFQEGEMKQKYPMAFEYLSRHKTVLESRKWYGKTARELCGEWYGLMYSADPVLFEQPKILTPAISKENNFAYDESGFYFPVGGGTVYGIILKKHLQRPDDYLYLLGVLNSKALEFFFKHITCYLGGGYREYHAQFLQQFPIRFPSSSKERKTQEDIVQKVKVILQCSNEKKLLMEFPYIYLSTYEGIELNECGYTFREDHKELAPLLSGQSDKGFVVYPNEGEDPIWVESKEKASYLVLALKKRSVKKSDTLKILIPRDDYVVGKILHDFKMKLKELEETSIEQMEKEINEHVYHLYGLDEHDEAVIEDFLKKF